MAPAADSSDPSGAARCGRRRTLLRPQFFLVVPDPAKSRIESVPVERLNRPLRLHHVSMNCRAVRDRVDPLGNSLRVDVNEQLNTELRGDLIAECDHLLKLPGRVDVENRKRQRRRIECLHGKMQHHRGVLADGIMHHRPLALGDNFSHHKDAFDFKALQMTQAIHGVVQVRSIFPAAHLLADQPTLRTAPARRHAASLP